MTIICPKCKSPNETGGAAPGSPINCKCGNVLSVPAAAKAGMGTGAIVAIVLAVCAIPCIGILAAIAIPNFIRYQTRAKMSEARVNVRSLCQGEQAFKQESGHFLAAGPLPATIPGRELTTFVADANFQKLAFDPGRVRFQYQAIPSADDSSCKCVARGDLNGSGHPSEVSYDTATGMVEGDRP